MYILNRLKEASRDWNETLDSFLKENGLERLKSDFCLYIGNDTWILIWVDDILISRENQEIKKLIGKLKENFNAKDLGEIRDFLGMNVSRSKTEIKISQTRFIEKMLQKFNLPECKCASIPMIPNF